MRTVKKILRRAKLAALTTRRAPSSIVRTPLPGFDPIYYLYWYPDVRVFPQGPLVHYIHYGWREGRDPSAGFSTEGYLKANPDVRESGCNPPSFTSSNPACRRGGKAGRRIRTRRRRSRIRWITIRASFCRRRTALPAAEALRACCLSAPSRLRNGTRRLSR